jgi:nucleotide-binding universal stress UspA family protein
VLQGDVADQLVELAAGSESPQIVMATRGRKTAGRKLMGPTAEAVLRQAPCPVVMVHDEDVAAVRQASEGAWASAAS